MTKIFCVEDDKSIRDLIVYALSNEGFEVKGFEDFKSMKKGLEGETPDLFLLDIMLPGEDGLFILDWLRHNSYKDLPVVMLTAKDHEIDKVKGLDLGADDYITKPFSILELCARVRAILRRVSQDDSTIIEANGIRIDKISRRVYVDDKEIELTYKEFELLAYLVQNKGIVLSRDKIMSEIWGFDFEGESRTVDVHIAFLRQKLGKKGQYIKTIRNVGYKMEDR
ncbi:response regulator transcription factor [uncultured Ezakiella sp.]|uniref:response regulator transcription factor n=1 Tax=uncultured Ezakiella sp. TaxID=1637529 RepID=UPI0025DFEF2F|nr:response regulator transcription factor [uncultured Ezakiella sp.]